MTLAKGIKLAIDGILYIFAAVGMLSTGIVTLLVLSKVPTSVSPTHPEKSPRHHIIEVEITRQ